MQYVSVKTDESSEILKDTIRAHMPGVGIAEDGDAIMIFLTEEDDIIVKLSQALAYFIINNYEKKHIGRLINANYSYLSPIDKGEVFVYTLEKLGYDNNELATLSTIRMSGIEARLKEYLSENSAIVIEGFINFRLGDYHQELENVVEESIERFAAYQEYCQFIKMLRYFVEIQDSHADIVHVTASPIGFSLYNQEFENITDQCSSQFMTDINIHEVNADDLLISSLITLAPKRIIIHNKKLASNKELVETIDGVFEGRICECEGCGLCMGGDLTARNELQPSNQDAY